MKQDISDYRHSWDMYGEILRTPILSFRFNARQQILAKLEYLQPTCSIKNRIAKALILSLENSEQLTKDTRYVVEATAGNTALSLQYQLKLRGYEANVVAVMSDKMSKAKDKVLIDAGVIIKRIPYTVAELNDGASSPLIEMTNKVAYGLDNSILANQFFSSANPDSHEAYTGREIVAQLSHPPDAIVIGVGTGGTLTGVARAIRSAGWASRIVLAEPQGSIIGERWMGRKTCPGKSIVEGIGGDFVPPILDLSLIDEVITITDVTTLKVWQRLQRSGIVVGSSSACVMAACERWLTQNHDATTTMCLFADHGSRYNIK